MSLGLRIRQLRQSRGLTQQQLSGGRLSKSFISLVERDRTKPSVETLVFFARRLGTSVDSLLGQDGHLPELAAESLLTVSREAIAERDYATTSKLLDTVTFLAKRYGLAEASREVLLQAGEVAVEQREFSHASEILALAHAACEREKDHWRLGRVLLLQGRLKLRLREFPQAVPLLEESLLVLRRARAGRDPARIRALIALGTVLGYMDKPEAALRRYQEAADSETARRDPILRGRAQWGVGWMNRKLGRLDDAGTFLLNAKDAFESAEELPDLMRVLHNLGQVEYEQGRTREALRHFHHALRVIERLQQPIARAAILTEIGRVHFSIGEFDDAAHFAASALEEARRSGDPIEAAEAQVVMGRIRLARGDVRPAVEDVRKALATFRERGLPAKVVPVARDFGLALKERGAHADAAEFLALVAESTAGNLEGVPSPARPRR